MKVTWRNDVQYGQYSKVTESKTEKTRLKTVTLAKMYKGHRTSLLSEHITGAAWVAK